MDIALVKTGDKVRLNSGGPKMTVIGIYGATEELRCIWPADDSIGCHDFHAVTVTRVEE